MHKEVYILYIKINDRGLKEKYKKILKLEIILMLKWYNTKTLLVQH